VIDQYHRKCEHSRRLELSLTIQTRVIRLDMDLFDLSVLDNQRIPLATVPTEDGAAVEG